jgi:hypothetical protein
MQAHEQAAFIEQVVAAAEQVKLDLSWYIQMTSAGLRSRKQCRG